MLVNRGWVVVGSFCHTERSRSVTPLKSNCTLYIVNSTLRKIWFQEEVF